jgi:hypothetical protein
VTRVFHLGERTKELDACALAYFDAVQDVAGHRSRPGHAENLRQMAVRRLLAAARSFGRAFRNRAAREALGELGPSVTFCPGCNKPLPSNQLGRPKKYHSVVCYNLARRLRR